MQFVAPVFPLVDKVSWTGQTSTGEKETGAAEETVERSVWVGVGLNGGGLKKQWLKKK